MPDSIGKLLLENIQPRAGRGSWHGGPTAVGAIRGVSAEQAAWTPAPGRKSIWQLALHIAYWKYALRRRIEGGAEHDRLVEVIAAVAPSRYGVEVPEGKRWAMGEMILGIAQHDAYHTGQIQLLKRLWASAR